MRPPELENLVRIGSLRDEPASRSEYDGLLRSAEARLVDAANEDVSSNGRFDLAYNAAHGLALAALRRLGYRPVNRYIVFQALEHTLDVDKPTCRLLAKCHEHRNRFEYGGEAPIDEALLRELLEAARELSRRLRALPPPAGAGS